MLIPHRQLRPAAPQAPRPGFSRWRRRLACLLLLLVALTTGVGLWIAFDPEALAALVDTARAVIGPQAVAQVETLAFRFQDQLRQAHYQATGAAPALSWAAPPAQPLPAGSAQPKAPAVISARPALIAPVAAAPTATSLTPNQEAIDSATPPSAPSVIWSPYVTGADGAPLLERALVSPDPSRPYVQAALVRIDLTHTQLHLVAGTTEPASPVTVARPGTIPHAVRVSGALLAAFNGGFKAANGAYGMAVDGTTLLPPQDDLATLGLYRDGSLRLGVWGQDMHQTADLVAFRQNCPLLLDHGVITPEAANPSTALWGKTVGNLVTTWRSGLGLSADGRTLIYVAGDGLTVPALADALRQDGATRAMQLDINTIWTRFVTFTQGASGALQAQKLLDGMQGSTSQFLIPDSRDFFYLTRLPERRTGA